MSGFSRDERVQVINFASHFWDRQGVIIEIVPLGATLNSIGRELVTVTLKPSCRVRLDSGDTVLFEQTELTSLGNPTPVDHQAILNHNSAALAAGDPDRFIGYDDDTGIGETVAETLERAHACIDLTVQAARARLTAAEWQPEIEAWTLVQRQMEDLRTILKTL